MKRLSLLCWLFFSAIHPLSAADFIQSSFTIGPQRFREGDFITISEVQAKKGTFGLGDEIIVRGSYQLASQEHAKLSIFVTQTEGDGKSKILPGQQQNIINGRCPGATERFRPGGITCSAKSCS